MINMINFCHSIKEDHRKPIYCVAFNTANIAYKDIAASVGSNRVSGH
jgi:hypothetical protein